MSYSYWFGVQLGGGVNLSGQLSLFRFGTLLLNLENGPLRLVFAHFCCDVLMLGIHAWHNLNPSYRFVLFE
jgi:hypothetical protein